MCSQSELLGAVETPPLSTARTRGCIAHQLLWRLSTKSSHLYNFYGRKAGRLLDYKVSFATTTYRIQIELNEAQLIGSYIISAKNDSLFEFAVYEFPGRGRPVITIAQIAQLMPNSSYRAVLSGRLDNERLITGDFVDVDDNRGTFKMMKQ